MVDAPPTGILIDAQRIAARVEQMANQIVSEWPGPEMTAVIALRGAFVFAADLLRRIGPRLDVAMDFIRVASYGGGRTSGRVRLISDLDRPLAGRHVLLIEDIVDSGRTVEFVQQRILRDRPASFRTAALLDKASRREIPVPVEYIGFEIPDVFVVGYGLDLAERRRHLPEVRVLADGDEEPSPADAETGGTRD